MINRLSTLVAASSLLVLSTVQGFAAPAYDWSGWYAGVNAGYGWGNSSNTDVGFSDASGTNFGTYFNALGPNGAYPSVTPKGFIGGGQAGFNWQRNTMVYGLEVDFQGTDISNSFSRTRLPPGFVTARGTSIEDTKLSWFSTARGRIGVTEGPWLLYGTAGLAVGEIRESISLAVTSVIPFYMGGSNSTVKAGWTAGAGAEYALGKWSARLEYLYYDLGRTTVTAVGTGTFATTVLSTSNSNTGHIVRAGLNYHFNAGQ